MIPRDLSKVPSDYRLLAVVAAFPVGSLCSNRHSKVPGEYLHDLLRNSLLQQSLPQAPLLTSTSLPDFGEEFIALNGCQSEAQNLRPLSPVKRPGNQQRCPSWISFRTKVYFLSRAVMTLTVPVPVSNLTAAPPSPCFTTQRVVLYVSCG